MAAARVPLIAPEIRPEAYSTVLHSESEPAAPIEVDERTPVAPD
jgi:hypothetical protein